jgi:hypothetical protein
VNHLLVGALVLVISVLPSLPIWSRISQQQVRV